MAHNAFVFCDVMQCSLVDCAWNVMAHAQKLNFVFKRNGRVHLNRRGRQFSRLLAAVVCASAVVMLDTPCSEVVWRVLATNSIPQFPLHFPSRASPCASTFPLESTYWMSTFLSHLLLPSAWQKSGLCEKRTWGQEHGSANIPVRGGVMGKWKAPINIFEKSFRRFLE